MRKLILLMVVMAAGMAVRAEQPVVTVTSRLANDNSLGFFAEIKGYGKFSIQLRFESVENAAVAAERLFTVEGNGQFFRLEPEDPAKPVEAKFYYNWLQGEIDPAVQPDFVYRLPFNAGTSTTPQKLSNVEAGVMRGNFVNFTLWEFPLSKDGTIFAARAGQVIMVNGFYPPSPGADPDYIYHADRNNEIYVQHADGTIAKYSVLDNASPLVAEGEMVYPDTPLAKAGAIEKERYVLHFSLYYYEANQSRMYADLMSQQHYLNPVFSTEFGAVRLDGEGIDRVTAQVDKKLVSKEKPGRSFWRRLFGGKK